MISIISGGVFYFLDKNFCLITESTIRNVSSKSLAFGGGFIYAKNNNFISIYKSLIFQGNSKKFGGAFLVENGNKINIINTYFINNIADMGSCFYLIAFNKVYIDNSYFIDNIAFTDSHIYFSLSESNNLVCKNSTFDYINKIKNVMFLSYLFNIFEKNLIFFENCKFKRIPFFSAINLKLGNLIINKTIFENEENFAFQIFKSTKSNIIIKKSIIKFAFPQKSYFEILDGSKSLFTFVQIIMNKKFIKFAFKDIIVFQNVKSNVYLTNMTINGIDFQDKNIILFESSNNSLYNIANSTFRSFKAPNIYIFKTRGDVFVSKTNFLYISAKSKDNLALFYFGGGNLFLYKNIFLSNYKSNSKMNLSIIYKKQQNNEYIHLIKNNFHNNKNSGFGGVFFFEFLNNSFILKNSNYFFIKQNYFKKNIAIKGGAIYFKNIPFNFKYPNQSVITNNIFEKNKAINTRNTTAEGGSLCFYSKKKNFPQNFNIFNIYSNSFIQNLAEIGGAFYFFNPKMRIIFNFNLNKNAFVLNFAKFYGNNFASAIHKLSYIKVINSSISISSNYKTISINNLASGMYFSDSCIVTIGGYDIFTNLITNYNQDFLTISDLNITIYKSYSQIINPNPDTFIFSSEKPLNFICLKKVISSNRPITTNILYNISLNNLKSSLFLKIIFRGCSYGERLNDQNECENCPINYYLFNRNNSLLSSDCLPCKDSLNCFGGNKITPRPGYWRLNNLSTTFFNCPKKEVCLADPSFAKNSSTYNPELAGGNCSEGYTGVLCLECEKNYGKINDYTCVKCDSFDYSFKIFCGIFVRVLVAAYFLSLSLNTCITISQKKNNYNEALKSNLFKILTNHMYTLKIIGSLPISFPVGFSNFLNLAFSFSTNFSDAFNLDCFLKKMGFNYPVHYFKLIISVLYPVVLLAIIMCFYSVRKFLKKYKKHNKKNNISLCDFPFSWVLTASIMNVLLLFYMDLMNVTFQMFPYLNVGDEFVPDYRLIVDYSVNYYKNEHQILIASIVFPILIFIGFGYFFFVFFKLWKGYKNMNIKKSIFLFKYGFIYYSYESKYFYWDLVVLIRKLLITIVYLYFFTNINNFDLYPILSINLIILLFYLIHQKYLPYEKKNFNNINEIESKSLLSLNFTIFFAIFYLSQKFYQKEFPNFVYFFLVIAILGFNGWFLFYWSISYSVLIFDKFKKIKNKINFLFRRKTTKNTTVKKKTIKSNKIKFAKEIVESKVIFKKFKSCEESILSILKQKELDYFNKKICKHFNLTKKNNINFEEDFEIASEFDSKFTVNFIEISDFSFKKNLVENKNLKFFEIKQKNIDFSITLRKNENLIECGSIRLDEVKTFSDENEILVVFCDKKIKNFDNDNNYSKYYFNTNVSIEDVTIFCNKKCNFI